MNHFRLGFQISRLCIVCHVIGSKHCGNIYRPYNTGLFHIIYYHCQALLIQTVETKVCLYIFHAGLDFTVFFLQSSTEVRACVSSIGPAILLGENQRTSVAYRQAENWYKWTLNLFNFAVKLGNHSPFSLSFIAKRRLTRYRACVSPQLLTHWHYSKA